MSLRWLRLVFIASVLVGAASIALLVLENGSHRIGPGLVLLSALLTALATAAELRRSRR